MLNKRILIFIAIILFLQIFCIGRESVDIIWVQNKIFMSPESPSVGQTINFNASFITKSDEINIVVLIAAIDNKTIFRKTYNSVIKNIPNKVIVNWKAVSGDHEIKFNLLKSKYRQIQSGNKFRLIKKFTVKQYTSQLSKLARSAPKTNRYTIAEKPDLIVSNLSKIVTQVNNDDSFITIWIKYKNTGNARSEEGRMKVIVDGIDSPYFPEVKNYYRESDYTMSGLLAGRESSRGYHTRLNSGRYKITVKLDIDNTNKEFNEGNNSSSIEIFIVKKND